MSELSELCEFMSWHMSLYTWHTSLSVTRGRTGAARGVLRDISGLARVLYEPARG